MTCCPVCGLDVYDGHDDPYHGTVCGECCHECNPTRCMCVACCGSIRAHLEAGAPQRCTRPQGPKPRWWEMV